VSLRRRVGPSRTNHESHGTVTGTHQGRGASGDEGLAAEAPQADLAEEAERPDLHQVTWREGGTDIRFSFDVVIDASERKRKSKIKTENRMLPNFSERKMLIKLNFKKNTSVYVR